jgi:hypothetical protein
LKTEIPNAAAAVKSAASGGVALFLDQISVAFFGVPIVLWVACFSGALFGVTWFPADARVNRWWALASNTLAGVFLTGLLLALWPTLSTAQAGMGFLIASAPLLVMRRLQRQMFDAPSTNPAPSDEGKQ